MTTIRTFRSLVPLAAIALVACADWLGSPDESPSGTGTTGTTGTGSGGTTGAGTASGNTTGGGPTGTTGSGNGTGASTSTSASSASNSGNTTSGTSNVTGGATTNTTTSTTTTGTTGGSGTNGVTTTSTTTTTGTNGTTVTTGSTGRGTTGTSSSSTTTGTTGRGTTGATSTSTTTGATGSTTTGTTGSSVTCTITATTTQGMIPTVGIVTYTTSLTGITSGEIQFGLAGGTTMKAPIDTTQASPRTLLLGMKGGKSYTYRVVLNSSAGACTSQDYTFMTGAVPSSVTKPTITMSNAAAHDKGFLVVSGGLSGTTTQILDADGEVVWWATGPSQNSSSHMSWDGSHMYMMSLNVGNSGAGKIMSVAMDGSGSTTLSGMANSHHDLTAIPGGLATPIWNSVTNKDTNCSIVERADSGGMLTTVLADTATVYNSTSSYHTNSIHYYASDDSYTIGDRNPNLYVKISRTGTLIWQLGGTSPKDAAKSFTGLPTWSVNHGHHMTSDGTFLVFNNTTSMSGPAVAWGFKLDTAGLKATQTLKYSAAKSNVLGDVQGLPNGNVLVTFSTGNEIDEITSAGAVVMKITNTSGFGYGEFRESLYGAPPR